MSFMGLVALALGLACFAVLVHDLRVRRTAFAQFAAARAKRPLSFWLGIAGWSACLSGCLLVSLADLGRQACGGRDPCTITIEAPE
jgi:hypothetical protein